MTKREDPHRCSCCRIVTLDRRWNNQRCLPRVEKSHVTAHRHNRHVGAGYRDYGTRAPMLGRPYRWYSAPMGDLCGTSDTILYNIYTTYRCILYYIMYYIILLYFTLAVHDRRHPSSKIIIIIKFKKWFKR